ncbi:MAG: uracil-DNA glycosylase [Actinomycetota bacterium]|nr:uracil-DNA glycosylase [Actinomycetota bacterium]
MTTALDKVDSLEELAEIASACTACRLSATRTNVVFASGTKDAQVMVVGEGPGQQEDEQGLPFVGRSGRLLIELLSEVGITREDVYIANVVKCRPPQNRDPRQDEIEMCKPFLRRQIELVDPVVVITLGNFSSKLLMQTTTGITRLRGKAYEWWGRYLVPTFHPAAALRGGERVKNDIRADIAIVRSLLEGRIIHDSEEAPNLANSVELIPVASEEQLGLFGTVSS